MSNISKNRVSLRIFGPDLLPEEISDLLQCLPTKSGKAGDIDPRQKRRTRVVKEGFWLLGSDESDDSFLERKVEMLLNKLTNDLEIWKDITTKFRVDIFCGLFLDNFNEGFDIGPDLLRKLGERNLKIGFDIYSALEAK